MDAIYQTGLLLSRHQRHIQQKIRPSVMQLILSILQVKPNHTDLYVKEGVALKQAG